MTSDFRQNLAEKSLHFQPLRQLRFQFINPLTFCRRYRHDVDLGKLRAQGLLIFISTGQIHFIRDHKPRPLRQERIVKVELFPQLLQIFDRVAAFTSGNIDNEQKNPATGDVAKKFVAKAQPAMRPFDQAGDVRDRCPVIS